MTIFDLDRCLKEDGGKCRTRDGRPARCLGILSQGTIAVAIMECGEESVGTRKSNGRVYLVHESGADIANLPRKLKCWVVMWRRENGDARAEGAETAHGAERRADDLRQSGFKPIIVPVEAEEPA